MIVTLLGIGLSAWLLPAFTRQWEDRQKAHELKTAIVADMASSTAQALSGADALWSDQRLHPFPGASFLPVPNRTAVHAVPKTRFADDWSVATLRIEARLRAYFPTDVVASWQLYSWFVDRFTEGYRAQAQAALFSAVEEKPQLDPGVANAVAELLAVQPQVIRGPSFAAGGPREFRTIQQLESSLQPDYRRQVSKWKASGQWGYSTLVSALLQVQEEIFAEVLAAHPGGYSTTFRDLRHHLLP